MTSRMRLSKAIFRLSPVLIAACCLLSACATTGVDERVALASLGQETQASQLIVLMVEPAVIVLPKVDDEDANADDEDSEGPGLIAGLLFDSLGERSRERSLEPITPYIDAQAWARELTDRLSDQGLEEVLAPDASVRVESNPIAAIRSMGEGRSTLLVTLRMGFDHRLEGFFVESEVALQHGKQPAIRARYVSEFINTERYGRWKPIDRKAPNIEYWTRNQGKAIHDALAQAQSELAGNLSADFREPAELGARTLWLQPVSAESASRISARELERRGNRVFVATTEGRYWLDSLQVDAPK